MVYETCLRLKFSITSGGEKKEVKKTALDEKKLKTHKNQMQWINLN